MSDLGVVELNIEESQTFENVLKICSASTGTNIDSVIAVRSGKVLNLQDIVNIGEVVDVFPAISGG
jgi:sulfur carrier protein ThiS